MAILPEKPLIIMLSGQVDLIINGWEVKQPSSLKYRSGAMTTKVIIDKAQGAAFIIRTGHINLGEMIEGTKALESDPSFRSIKKALSDLSAADMSDISTDEFKSYAHYCNSTIKGLKIAIVAPSDLSFGIARMIEILSDVEDIMVFRKMNEALLWLDVILPEDF